MNRGPAVAYNVESGKTVEVSASEYAQPVYQRHKQRTIVTDEPVPGFYTQPRPVAVAAAAMPMPMPAPVYDPAGLVWGIAILGLFVFIFCVTIIILLFTISFDNNQIAGSILAGLSALFALVMVGLMFRYDRVRGYGGVVAVEDEVVAAPAAAVEMQEIPQRPMLVAAAPAPVASAPVVEGVSAVNVAVPGVAVETPLASAAVGTPPGGPVPAGGNYYYAQQHPHYAGHMRYQQPYYYRG